MISHLVLFKFKPGIVRSDARVENVARAMAALPATIPQIRGWEHGFNITDDGGAWDYGLRALFDSEADLHAYFEHSAHLPVLARWEEVADLLFCDYEVS
jgi:hypothetical protein